MYEGCEFVCAYAMKEKNNIRGFSVSVYFKNFQKIKQSVHIPFRKMSFTSSHGRLSNCTDACDESVYERVSLVIRSSFTLKTWICSQMNNVRNPHVRVSVYWCFIQDLRYTHEWILFTCRIHLHIKLMNNISATQHGIEKGDRHILYQYNYQYTYL